MPMMPVAGRRLPAQKWPKIAILVRGLLLCLVAGALFLNLRGIGESLSPWSQATVTLLANLFYDEAGRNKTTVLLFRERDLTAAGEIDPKTGEKIRIPFPVPYSVHVDILEALAAREPAAIFIDFAFVDERLGDDVARLRETFCELRDTSIPVYLATFNYEAPHHGLRKDLFASRTGERSAAPCFEVVPVGYSAEKSGTVNTYSLVQARSAGSTGIPAAALRLFPGYAPENLAAYREGMDIVWGSLPPRERRSDTPCAPLKLLDTALRLATDGPAALTRDCPYSNTLSVFSLFNETGSGGDDDDVTALVRGKIILYGGAFQGTDDWLRSPVHGTIPGVYLHAMALDNLLVFNADNDGVPSRYKRIGEHRLGGEMSTALWVDIALITTGVGWHLLVVAFRSARGHGSPAIQLQRRRLLQAAGFFLPYILLSFAILVGLYRADKAWIGILQFVCCLAVPAAVYALMRFGERRRQALRGRREETLGERLGLICRDALIDYSWVVLIALLCGIAFHFLDLGPRNFWAFAAFIAFTHMVDKRMAGLARQIREARLWAKLRRRPDISFVLLIAAVAMAWAVSQAFLDLTPHDGNVNSMLAAAMALAATLALVFIARLAPWLYYRDMIILLHARKGK